jgi:hypothetical protein
LAAPIRRTDRIAGVDRTNGAAVRDRRARAEVSGIAARIALSALRLLGARV